MRLLRIDAFHGQQESIGGRCTSLRQAMQSSGLAIFSGCVRWCLSRGLYCMSGRQSFVPALQGVMLRLQALQLMSLLPLLLCAGLPLLVRAVQLQAPATTLEVHGLGHHTHILHRADHLGIVSYVAQQNWACISQSRGCSTVCARHVLRTARIASMSIAKLALAFDLSSQSRTVSFKRTFSISRSAHRFLVMLALRCCRAGSIDRVQYITKVGDAADVHDLSDVMCRIAGFHVP